MVASKAVKVIPATAGRFAPVSTGIATLKKVVAYARVSTDYDEQLTRYEAQVDYYTRYIKSNSNWSFVEVYTDEGISATSTKKREGFKRMIADGKVSLPYKQFLGYEKGEDGLPKIVENEAAVIRLIYKLFLEGKTTAGIAKYLTESKIPSPAGKEVWQQSTVTSILQNEKYKGDAILQKSYLAMQP